MDSMLEISTLYDMNLNIHSYYEKHLKWDMN